MICIKRLPLVAVVLTAMIALRVPAADNSTSEQPTDTQQPINFAAAEFWQTLDGNAVSDSWQFADGEVRLVNPRGGKGSIISPELPANFELSFEWKIEEKTNTGLKYRVRKFGNQLFNNSFLGVEYQIMDDDPASTAKGSTASIYDLIGTSADKTVHPVGQWNSARIVAIGNRLEHYLNGQLVSSTTTSGPEWDKTIALSKFYGAEDFGRPKPGDRIMLTDHGGKAVYRGFQFVAKQVDAADQAEIVSAGPFLGNALRNSWADQDSIVIWTRTTRNPDFVADGKAFVSFSSRQARELSNGRDADVMMNSQLPDGATLDEMIGACPGAAGRVRLTYFPGKQRNASKTTEWITTEAGSDFTAQWKLEGLKPDTQYAVIVEAQAPGKDATTAVVRGAFQTAPKVENAKDVSFCFTTCHDFIRRDDGMMGHKIYPTMSKMQPDFIVHAGDIEYYDKPDPWALTLELMRFKWGRIFACPNNRDFYSRTTSYFLKDDHDTLKNDCWAGQTYGTVSFEQGVRLFNEEQFPSLNPRYTTVRWGKDLQVWFLEGRDYRSPNTMPDGPEKTILGKVQKEWLFKTLDESDAKFKLICSPTPVVGPDRANKKDNHANDVFAHEGDEIRTKLSEIDDVIVLCGDRHWQYASFDPDSGLWEFGCGPGSEKHELGWKDGDERPFHKFLRVKGGFLSGELEHVGKDKQPRLTLRHHKVTGEAVSEFVFPVPDP